MNLLKIKDIMSRTIAFAMLTALLSSVLPGCGKILHEGNSEKDCDMKCIIWFLYVGGYLFPPPACGANAVLKPGDTTSFTIAPPPYLNGYTHVRGCSSNPWTLTATPPAGAIVQIERLSSPCYFGTPGTLLAQSASAGASASISSGSAGCMTNDMDVIRIWGLNVTGTVNITFN